MSKKIGFIGLGIMGKPMAINLIKAGYSLVVFDINKDAMNEVTAYGAENGVSPADVASQCDVVITMLPNSPHVIEVVLGNNGVLEGAKPGTILLDMSSIAPRVSKELCASSLEKGVIMLDAPVSGGEAKAIDGTLSIMVGGSKEAFSEVEGIFKAMGSSVVHIGEIGSGNVVKIANQIIVAVNIAAMSEALVLATKAGVDPEKVYRAIRGGLAGSVVLESKVPKILQRDFNPGFRVELHVKDLNNAIDMASDYGVTIPLASQVLDFMHEMEADGKAKEDHCCIIQHYEKLAQIEVGSK